MPSPDDASGRLRRNLEEEGEAYTGGEDHPLGAYAGAMGVYVASIAALAAAAGMVFAPRATRLATATLTALACSDLLHFARVRTQRTAEE
ncbi:hypothetical protein [Streptomyces abikoensis]|uniref:Uncharacterized protein n=1 Tax=Streptomyces abikoensis TaxID=97398 RepID=A0ABW7TAQ8_9ACTN